MMKADPVIRQRAKTLRRNITDAEIMLWSRLQRKQLRGWQFRRQHPIGSYIVDFACPKLKLVIEVDGATHSEDREIAYDERRTRFLEKLGWSVHRIWNDDIYEDLDAVVNGIVWKLPPPTQR
ncbi:MAG: DUF559 domain-containing protein [Pseudomonadota bacterium]